MKTIQELQDEYAKDLGFTDWKLLINNANIVSRDVRIIAKRYAEESIRECAKIVKLGLLSEQRKSEAKQSILNTIKELK
jgi:hypothetical protein